MSTKRKAPGKLAPPTVKPSAKNAYKSTIDEAHTSVSKTDFLPSSAPETIDISSDADSDDEDISDEEDAVNQGLVNGDKKPQTNGKTSGHHLPSPKVSAAGDDGAESSDDEATSPSFGELLRGNETIDVPALLQQSSAASNALAQPTRATIAPPSHQSLTTVLTQALKTDDVDLLESCLHTTDLPTIRNTIENIDSTLAGNLLNKLAARLYRRPGRAGSLMQWVQWTLIAHGGALASQPKVIQGLGGLQKVLAERAKGLNSLLALKGKLDMLEGQMDMRRKLQRSAGLIRQGDDEDEDEDVIYVEGEENNTNEKALPNGAGRSRRAAIDDEDDDDDDRMVNGVIGDSSDEEDSEEQEEDDDDDAEESLDEDEVDHNDMDESMGEDEESDVEAPPPSKVQKVAKSFSKRK